MELPVASLARYPKKRESLGDSAGPEDNRMVQSASPTHQQSRRACWFSGVEPQTHMHRPENGELTLAHRAAEANAPIGAGAA
jgi:hypothetical protein